MKWFELHKTKVRGGAPDKSLVRKYLTTVAPFDPNYNTPESDQHGDQKKWTCPSSCIYCKNIGSCRCNVALAKIIRSLQIFNHCCMCLFVLKKSVEKPCPSTSVNFKSSHQPPLKDLCYRRLWVYSTIHCILHTALLYRHPSTKGCKIEKKWPCRDVFAILGINVLLWYVYINCAPQAKNLGF